MRQLQFIITTKQNGQAMEKYPEALDKSKKPTAEVAR